jgi:hypothetical protein
MTADHGGAPQNLRPTEVAARDLHPQAQGALASKGEPEGIVCPVCGGHNPPDPMFQGIYERKCQQGKHHLVPRCHVTNQLTRVIYATFKGFESN